MKWYSTEAVQSTEDYSVPDSMMAFAKKNGITVRSHNVMWDDHRFQPAWATSLSPAQLSAAAPKRVNSIMSRFKGQVIGWDVVNENLPSLQLLGREAWTICIKDLPAGSPD